MSTRVELQRVFPISEEICKRCSFRKSKATCVSHLVFVNHLTLWQSMIFVNSRCQASRISRHCQAGLSGETWYGPLTNGPRMACRGASQTLITSENQDPNGRLRGSGFAGRVLASPRPLSCLAAPDGRTTSLCWFLDCPFRRPRSSAILAPILATVGAFPKVTMLVGCVIRRVQFGPSIQWSACHGAINDSRVSGRLPRPVGLSNPRCGVSIARPDQARSCPIIRIVADRRS